MIKKILITIIALNSKCLADPSIIYIDTPSDRALEHQSSIAPTTLSANIAVNAKKTDTPPTEHTHNSTAVKKIKNIFNVSAKSCKDIKDNRRIHQCSITLIEHLSPNRDQLKNLIEIDDSTNKSIGTPSDIEIHKVVLLSLNGKEGEAYELSHNNSELSKIFWHIISEIGSLQQLYLYTSIADERDLKNLPIRTRKKVIDRLLRSPAPNTAQKWIEGNPNSSMNIRSLQYKLANKDYGNLTPDTPKAGYLISTALQNAGDLEQSLIWFDVNKFSPEMRYSKKLLGQPQADDPTAWGELSRRIALPSEATQLPQLKAARFLLEHSESTRNSLTSLMNEANSPTSQQKLSFEFSD